MDKKSFLAFVSQSFFLVEFIPNSEVRNFIACQFALESSFGTSVLAKRYHNLGGMKVPHRRLSYRYEAFDGYCVYDSYNSFFKDYISWILYNRPYQNAIEHLDSFKLFLRDSGYCPEKDYISRIETLYNQYFVSPKN